MTSRYNSYVPSQRRHTTMLASRSIRRTCGWSRHGSYTGGPDPPEVLQRAAEYLRQFAGEVARERGLHKPERWMRKFGIYDPEFEETIRQQREDEGT